MSYLRPKKTKGSRSWEINGESSAAVPISPQKSHARGVLAEVHAVLHLRRCWHANQPCLALPGMEPVLVSEHRYSNASF